MMKRGYVFFAGFMGLVMALSGDLDTFAMDADGMTVESEATVYDAESYSNKQVYDFVQRQYRVILGRDGEEAGVDTWYNNLINHTSNGAEVAWGFIFSDEFKEKNLSDSEYIEVLYQAFLDRSSDADGKAVWMKLLEDGMSREYVYCGFAHSNEFQGICESYGIERGTVTLSAPKDQNEGVTKFVYRSYKEFLGRTADEDGLNMWTETLLSGGASAKDVAFGFVFSDEFKEKNTTNTEFVQTLYLGLFGREADEAGLNQWVQMLDQGVSKEMVFKGFANSSEFKELVNGFGLDIEIEDFGHELAKEVYDRFIYGTLKEELGLSTYLPSGSRIVSSNPLSEKWCDINGIISGCIEDLNRDGSDELIVPYLEAGEGINGRVLKLRVYALENYTPTLKSDVTLDSYFNPFMKYANLSVLEKDGEKYLYYENMYAPAQGSMSTYHLMRYNGEELKLTGYLEGAVLGRTMVYKATHFGNVTSDWSVSRAGTEGTVLLDGEGGSYETYVAFISQVLGEWGLSMDYEDSIQLGCGYVTRKQDNMKSIFSARASYHIDTSSLNYDLTDDSNLAR